MFTGLLRMGCSFFDTKGTRILKSMVLKLRCVRTCALRVVVLRDLIATMVALRPEVALRARPEAPTWGPDLRPQLEAPIWGPGYITIYILHIFYITSGVHYIYFIYHMYIINILFKWYRCIYIYIYIYDII